MSDGFRYGVFEEKITKALYRDGFFRDRRSKIKRDVDGEPHFKLEGEDMVRQRQAVFQRFVGQCQLKEPGCTVAAMELHHVQGGICGRCDCQRHGKTPQLLPVCRNCHRGEHVQVRSPRVTFELKQAAAQDFNEIYKEEQKA